MNDAILHFDGDAFFTSVEQALHPEWKGRPVVTGQERGIIACASYEAKALGIRRGVPLWEARRQCPDLMVLPSDYETYSLFSSRLFEIARRYTPVVEEYSIDEGFADLTGMRRVFRGSYERMARHFQAAIEAELGVTVSVGLGFSKSLAKLASDFRKPSGLTVAFREQAPLLLRKTPVEAVWGFGPNTARLLRKHGVGTAWDFVSRPEAWAGRLLGKTGRELWNELRGTAVYAVRPGERPPRATISKCKTFTAPLAGRDPVYARLVRNVESACIKLRRHRLRARRFSVTLRRSDYLQNTLEARLSRASSATQEILPAVHELFDRLFVLETFYRATMIVLGDLEEDRLECPDLFEDRPRIEALAGASRVMDRVNGQYGKHRLGIGETLFIGSPANNGNPRDRLPWRKTRLLAGESPRRRIALPLMGIRV